MHRTDRPQRFAVPVAAALLAVAIAPMASAAPFLITPIAFDFGNVGVGSTAPEQTVTVTNVSDSAQTLSLAGGGAEAFGGVQNCEGVTLAPGASCQISYAFAPTALGATSTVTNLVVNGQAATFSFIGTGVESFLISATRFDFGTVPVGTTAPEQAVTVTNVSGTPQTLSLAGGGAGVFGGVQDCQDRTLAPGASCRVAYAFTPQVAGLASETTMLEVNGQAASFSFSGTGGDVPANGLLVSPTAFDFGNVGVGATAPGQSVTVTNIGTMAQTLSLAGGGAGVFGGVQDCQGTTLAPGASCHVTYAFAPTALGPVSETTTLQVNDQLFDFAFFGRGVNPFLISPVGFDFGEVEIGMLAPEQVVDVTNVSGSSLTLSLAGGGAEEFGGAQNCQGATLAPGAACQIFYAFRPTVAGRIDRTTNLLVNGQAAEFSFTGVGIERVTAVPAPAGIALLLLGLAGALRRPAPRREQA